MSPGQQTLGVGSVGEGAADFEAMLADACPTEDGWSLSTEPLGEPVWLSAGPDGAAIPHQGWKLHVSADALGAEDTLRCVLPVLATDRATFKVAATQDMLTWLNVGAGGKSQVGKFITVYPRDDEDAVRLARALLIATEGRIGPAIPSDRRLGPDSVVYYRYGTLRPRLRRTPLGEIAEMLTAPDGSLVPDRRPTRYRPPAWVDDPFVAAGLPVTDGDGLILAGRFLRTATLHLSGGSLVCLATDLERGGTCVVKKAERYFAQDLAYEADVLRLLAPDTTRPEVLDLVEDQAGLLLVLEDIRGESLEMAVGRAAISAEVCPVANWGSQLAHALAAIHGAGFVFGDVTPRNVILTPEGKLRLIDYGVTQPPTAERLAFGAGTSAFASPEQLAADGLVETDDVHGLGATLHYVISSAPPVKGIAPLRILVPGINEELTGVVRRCLAPTRAERYPSAAAVADALAAIESQPAVEAPPWGTPPASRSVDEARNRALELAVALGDRICSDATFSDDGAWWNGHVAQFRGIRHRDLNMGDAGIVIVLAELVRLAGIDRHLDVLASAAAALANGPEEPEPLPGLYVGEAGVGIALLRAAAVLGEERLVEAAASRSAVVRSFPHVSPDLFNGSAGRLWLHLELHRAAGDRAELEAAIEAGSFLLDAAEETPAGGLRWVIPDGYDSLSGTHPLGHAHGATGIADALLDLFDATRDRRWLDAAAAAGRRVAAAAIPIASGAGTQWPEEEGEDPVWACWCVGAGGIGRFLRRLATHAALEGGLELADRAAWSVARTARWTEPIQCHGLASNAELLVDAYAATGDPSHLREAYSLAELFEATVSAQIDGRGGNDYLLGSAGLLATLVRLADPEGTRHAIRPTLTAPGWTP